MSITIDIADHIATIVLDRPPVNALTTQLYERVGAAFRQIGENADVRCVIFRAEGEKAFCAGLDLKEFLESRTIEDDRARTAVILDAFKAVYDCAVPVIAAVHAPALGAGFVLTTLCDIRLATPRATFGLPEINVGRCGGGAFAGRYVSPGVLRRMYFTGHPLSAQQAQVHGLVDEIVEEADLLDRARALAHTIAAKSPIAIRLAKQSLNACEGLPVFEGYAVEQTYSERLFFTEDAREAALSVIEKRQPNFVGR